MGEFGSVQGQEVAFRGQLYLRRVQTMRSDEFVVGAFFHNDKKNDTWTHMDQLQADTHVLKSAVSLQATFDLL